MTITRLNHYVPKWYQKRFLSSGKNVFYYLNLIPSVIDLPDGRKKTLNGVHWPFSTTQCFCQKDLYTTQYYGFLNDEIERYLFGKIDDIGVIAVDAMAEQEFKSLHDNFQKFFEYMDIQKIRTPKGLAWIQSKFPSLSHNQLLYEMQRIQRLHCTIWFESVREIVYARNSKVKFLISDHPVTIYNPECHPDSKECSFPNEPRIEMKASQTIFPLDSNRCLILTNLDYARNPNLSDPKAFRPNANPFRPTLARMDNTICKRELTEVEVTQINLIIKLRAKQFLAAENKEWLYPEKAVHFSWKDMGKVLLPPEDELYHFGGEVFGKYNDGTYFYHDQYGRTQKEASYLKKEPISGKIGPNAPCPCGSGKKYKKCCRDKPEDERPSSLERSIRERNLKFFEILVNILGFDEKKDWNDIRRELTNKKIADIHKAVAVLWPLETDLMSLLPRPDATVSRALYSGLLDPRVTYKEVAAFSLYVDEILVINPFPNPNIIRKEYNPIDNPSQHRQATLKNIIFLISLMPLIEAGRVNLIPDPLNFNAALRREIFAEAQKRQNQVKIDKKDFEAMEKLAKEDFKRFLFNGPEERLKSFIRRVKPQIAHDELKQTLEYIKRENEQDPLATLYPPSMEESGGQMLMSHLSPNLELGMFLAQATGSFILTHHPYRWSEIRSSINYFYGDYQSPWESIADYLTNFEMDFIHFFDHRDFLLALKNGNLGHMRMALRNIWNAVQREQPTDSSQIDHLIKEINLAREKMSISIDKLMKQKNRDCEEYFRVAKTKGKLSCKIAPVGHSTNIVYRLLLAHAGHEKYLKALPLSLYVEHLEEEGKSLERAGVESTSK